MLLLSSFAMAATRTSDHLLINDRKVTSKGVTASRDKSRCNFLLTFVKQFQLGGEETWKQSRGTKQSVLHGEKRELKPVFDSVPVLSFSTFQSWFEQLLYFKKTIYMCVLWVRVTWKQSINFLLCVMTSRAELIRRRLLIKVKKMSSPTWITDVCAFSFRCREKVNAWRLNRRSTSSLANDGGSK